MGAAVRPDTSDPLAGYTPDWRTAPSAPTASAVDPLAGYTPDWRRQPLRAPRMPQTAPTGEIAPADATARIAGMPSGNLGAKRLIGPAKLASDVFQAGADAVSHPLTTAATMAAAPLQAAATLGQFASQQAHRVPGAPVISGRAALESGAQLAATALAGPVEGALERRIGRLAAKAATGAGVGAVFMPEQPGVGALLGGAAGAGAHRIGARPPNVPQTSPSGIVDQRAAKVQDLADVVASHGPEGRTALELAWEEADRAGDHPKAALLRDVLVRHNEMPTEAAPPPQTPPQARISAPPEAPAASNATPGSELSGVGAAPVAPPNAGITTPGMETLHRGVNTANVAGHPDGSYWTPSRDYARDFTQSGRDTEIRTQTIPAAQIYDPDLLPDATNEAEMSAAMAAARQGGYRALRVSEGAAYPPSVFVLSDRVPAEAAPTATEPEPVAEAPAEPAPVAPRLRQPSAPHESARDGQGRLRRNLAPVADEGLVRELAGLQNAHEAALEHAGQVPSQFVRLTDEGGAVSGGTLAGGIARQQAKTLGGAAERVRTELARRGLSGDALDDRMSDILERDGLRGDAPPARVGAGQGTPFDTQAGARGERYTAPDFVTDAHGNFLFANPVGPALRTTARLATAGVERVWNAEGVANIRDAFNRILDPAGRSPEAAQAATVLRAHTGGMARTFEQTSAALHDASRAFDAMPEAERLAFIDRVETGRPQPTPALQRAHDTMRGAFDTTRDQIRALGTGKLDHFITDYFPHVWDDPAAAKAVFGQAMGKRPMQGSRAFLKQRTIPTTADGIAAGLTPVTTNPVDLTLLKLREMQRYLMAHTALAEMKSKGLVQYVRAGAAAPDGYARINDDIATVFGPKQGAVTLPAGANIAPGDVTVQGRRIMGQYYAPEPVARVVNNYLSPGLRGNALFDAYRFVGNSLNQAQLGLSAFHAGMTSLDAAVSRTALGLEQASHGKPLLAIRNIASAPAAPVTNLLLGRKIRAEYLKPGSQGGDIAALAQAVADAGGRVRQDTFYAGAATEFRRALQNKRYVRAGVRLVPALLEKAMVPIMEHVVPMQKLGVFGDLAREALSQLPPGATDDVVRAALAKVWDSVDNRMGQLVYDNLFWNKTVKDLLMASTRSVGWNLGTIRELGGGTLDYIKAAGSAARGQRPELTHRMAYVAALPITVGTLGAVLNVAVTGEPPQELKDYFFPRTGTFDEDGNPNRVSLPSYMKDVFAYAGHPWQTVKHKMAPVLSLVGEMLNNEDFYGDEIRNPDDPLVQQLAQEAAYLGKSALPFAVRNAQEGAKRGASPGERAAAFVGVTPASRETVRSPAQNRLAAYTGATMPSGASPEDADARGHRADVLHALRGRGDLDVAVRTAVDAGQLDDAQLERLTARAALTPMQERFKALPLAKALRVFDLADDREKALLADLLQAKIAASPP